MHGTRPTLRDVARLSGVSEISVSRVMRNAPNISEKLRERVEQAARQLGYTPNRLAGGLKSQSSNLVAVVVPSMGNNVFPEVVDEIDRILTGHGRRMVLGLTQYDIQREEAVLRDLMSWSPSGLILTGLEHTEASRALLAQARIPVVEIMDIDRPPGQSAPLGTVIGVSHHAAGAAMADHLLARGYRRIGYVGAWGESDIRSLKRRQGFEARLAERGMALAARHVAPEASSIGLGRQACARILEAEPQIDALFFANDDLAVGGLLHCLAAGIAVPDRLALAGFNGIGFADAMPQRLTTIRTPRARMGALAAETLLGQGAGTAAGAEPGAVIDLGFSLLARETS